MITLAIILNFQTLRDLRRRLHFNLSVCVRGGGTAVLIQLLAMQCMGLMFNIAKTVAIPHFLCTFTSQLLT